MQLNEQNNAQFNAHFMKQLTRFVFTTNKSCTECIHIQILWPPHYFWTTWRKTCQNTVYYKLPGRHPWSHPRPTLGPNTLAAIAPNQLQPTSNEQRKAIASEYCTKTLDKHESSKANNNQKFSIMEKNNKKNNKNNLKNNLKKLKKL